MEHEQTEHQPPWMAYHPGQSWPTEMLSIARVLDRTAMSKSSLYLAIQQQRAPAPLHRGRQSVWDSREIEAWNRWQAATLPRMSS